VHIIFYEWGCIDEYGPTKIKKDIIAELEEMRMKIPPDNEVALPELVQQFNKDRGAVRSFVEEFGEINIHVVNRPTIENWLLPSFLPIAYLATDLVKKTGLNL
jgi:hypothetical protein